MNSAMEMMGLWTGVVTVLFFCLFCLVRAALDHLQAFQRDHRDEMRHRLAENQARTEEVIRSLGVRVVHVPASGAAPVCGPLIRPQWRTPDVLALARRLKDGDTSAAPILADALQDAGCDREEVLAHLRDPDQSHNSACWVLAAILPGEKG